MPIVYHTIGDQSHAAFRQTCENMKLQVQELSKSAIFSLKAALSSSCWPEFERLYIENGGHIELLSKRMGSISFQIPDSILVR